LHYDILFIHLPVKLNAELLIAKNKYIMNGKEYYYLNGDAKVGPFQLEALKGAPITPGTLVWNNSLPDWVEARTLPELQSLFAPAAAPPPTSNYNPAPNAYNPANRPYNAYSPGGANPPMPENYLVWAILTTVLCCWPFGIAAIVNAAKVSSAYAIGDYAGSQRASENAKTWSIWTAVAGVIFWVLYFTIMLLIGMAGAGITDLFD
jgi:hypothetical protein